MTIRANSFIHSSSIRDMKDRLNIYRRYFNWRHAGCIFVHVPKAAGTSISHAIYGRTLGHYTVREIQATFPSLFKRSLVFSIVRNPYSRLYSAYRFARAGRTADMGIRHMRLYQTPEFETFEKFVTQWLVNQDLEEIDYVFRPQSSYVCIDGELALDELFRFEALELGIERLQSLLGRRLSVGVKNSVLRGEDLRDYYSAQTRSIVSKLYHQDFDRFGYDKSF